MDQIPPLSQGHSLNQVKLDLNLFASVYLGFSGGLVVKNLPANAGDTGDLGSIPELGRSPG